MAEPPLFILLISKIILLQCSGNSLYFSGNSKNRAGEALFFFLSHKMTTPGFCVLALLFCTVADTLCEIFEFY